MNWAATVMSSAVIEKTGRRFLMIFGMVGMLVCNAAIAVLYGYPDSQTCSILLVAATEKYHS